MIIALNPTRKTASLQEVEAFLGKHGFERHSGTYVGCPEHGNEEFACPLDADGNCLCQAPDACYWKINGMKPGEFINALHCQKIAYVFAEKTGEIRKIGAGNPSRILDDLRAHYNHGYTSPKKTKNDRATENRIAKACRRAGGFVLFVKPSATDKDAIEARSLVKSEYAGWLDWGQGGTGVPSTL